ncbi:MAG: hypothetical protein LBI45_05365 [Bacteroidales bacterium]|jgi:hypothetical protein|nr:hypothetical protein [Bacteroidales bacterium]
MEKQKNSDIEVEVKFRGMPIEQLPDFEFAFHTELHSKSTYMCSKSGNELVNCTISEVGANFPKIDTTVKCIIENHNFMPGRLCVLVHIKWPDHDYADGVRNDIYREKLSLILSP